LWPLNSRIEELEQPHINNAFVLGVGGNVVAFFANNSTIQHSTLQQFQYLCQKIQKL
jgi:hypothetical protein